MLTDEQKRYLIKKVNLYIRIDQLLDLLEETVSSIEAPFHVNEVKVKLDKTFNHVISMLKKEVLSGGLKLDLKYITEFSEDFLRWLNVSGTFEWPEMQAHLIDEISTFRGISRYDEKLP